VHAKSTGGLIITALDSAITQTETLVSANRSAKTSLFGWSLVLVRI